MFESVVSIWSGSADRERLTISLTRRSKGRQGVPPGGAEQGSASRRRGMVPGECSYNFWWRLFLGVFPTADKSRGTRPETTKTEKKGRYTSSTVLSHFVFHFYQALSCSFFSSCFFWKAARSITLGALLPKSGSSLYLGNWSSNQSFTNL